MAALTDSELAARVDELHRKQRNLENDLRRLTEDSLNVTSSDFTRRKQNQLDARAKELERHAGAMSIIDAELQRFANAEAAAKGVGDVRKSMQEQLKALRDELATYQDARRSNKQAATLLAELQAMDPEQRAYVMEALRNA